MGKVEDVKELEECIETLRTLVGGALDEPKGREMRIKEFEKAYTRIGEIWRPIFEWSEAETKAFAAVREAHDRARAAIIRAPVESATVEESRQKAKASLSRRG